MPSPRAVGVEERLAEPAAEQKLTTSPGDHLTGGRRTQWKPACRI
jgi:hypothetical protein